MIKLIFACLTFSVSSGLSCTPFEAFAAAQAQGKLIQSYHQEANRVFVGSGLKQDKQIEFSVAQIYPQSDGSRDHAYVVAGSIWIDSQTCKLSDWFMTSTAEVGLSHLPNRSDIGRPLGEPNSPLER